MPWQSPLLNLPTNAALTEKQLDYCRFVLRYGFQHPEYDDVTNRLQRAVNRPQIGLGSLA
jgi:hypothetical protein